MALAHPHHLSISRNYSEPTAVITLATSMPGENINNFYARLDDRQPWGASGRGRHVLE